MRTIYLSSTYEDLKEYRHVVHDALRKAGHHVIGMEDYVAKDERPVNKCLNDVKEADIYIGLIGFRYGYIPPAQHNNPNSLSITELEYRCAEDCKKPCLVFLAKDDARIPLNYVDAYTGEGRNGQDIKAFRQHLMAEKVTSQFSEPHKLSMLVLAAIATIPPGPEPVSEKLTGSESSAVITWDIEKQGSPYPGLMHFDERYASVFFGRDAEVRDVLDRMHGPHGRFIIVSGSSGVGKSSLIDAGILPKLKQGGLPRGTQCECVRMVPNQQTDPWSALAVAIKDLVTRADLRQDAVAENLIKNPNSLSEQLHRIIKASMKDKELVIFLDQMEELFASQDLTKAMQFLDALYRAAQEKKVWVLASIRSDHLHYCHESAYMRAVLGGSGHYPLGPIEPHMVKDLIARPALCAGLSLADGLVHRMAVAAGEEPGNLVLLAFLLNQMFEKRQKTTRELTAGAYEALQGVAGAIKRHAEQVEVDIKQNEGEKASERLSKLFQALVTVNMEGVPMRRRLFVSEVPPEMNGLLKTLVETRLLHTEGVDSGATVSISHEKLFEAWPSLKDYVEANKKQLIDQRLLESRARKWQELDRPWFAVLASGQEYRDFQNSGTAITTLTKAYLLASRRAIWIKLVMIGLVMLLVGWTVYQQVKSPEPDSPIAPEMVTVSAGTFQQGSVEHSNQQPIHDVTIKPFKIGKYEVTFDEYDRFVRAKGHRKPDDYGWGRESRPVINVSWEDARAYAKWLSDQTHQNYRLPTESEWEYAARSEGKIQRWAGTSEEDALREYAVYLATSRGQTEPVGKFFRERKANDLGLYDMSGNVWEWVQDCWHENYKGAPQDGSPWLQTNGGCSMHVVRGGAWNGTSDDLRASHRGRDAFGNRTSALGFRLVQDP